MRSFGLALLFVALLCIPIWADPAESLKLPTRDAEVAIPLIRKEKDSLSFQRIEEILGKPDSNIGSYFFTYLYRLSDRATVTVMTRDKMEIMLLEVQTPPETEVIIPFKKPNQPPQTRATSGPV